MFREYPVDDDWYVLVGRSDSENDELSLREAKSFELWFHVKGVPGSHLLLRSDTEKKPSKEVIKKAAALAAYFSKARQAGIVPVIYTEAKNLSKHPRFKAGTVSVKKERTVKVRPQAPETEET